MLCHCWELLVTCVILYMCWSTVTTEVEAMFVSSGVSFGQLLGWCGTSYIGMGTPFKNAFHHPIGSSDG